MAVDYFLNISLLFPVLGLSPLSCFPLGATVGKCAGMAEGLKDDEQGNITQSDHISDKRSLDLYLGMTKKMQGKDPEKMAE